MSKNDITGDEIKSKPSSKDYDKGYDLIFGKKNKIILRQREEVKAPLQSLLAKEEIKRLIKEQDCV